MRKIISDPSALTKAKLKEELIKHDIKLPPANSKKQVYIDLYLTHLGQEDEISTTENQNLSESDSEGFSSEAETESGENSESVNNSAINLQNSQFKINPIRAADTVVNRLTEENMPSTSVSSLSNEEIAEELRSLGFVPGPITDSTRRVYEKKLVRLRQTGGGDAYQAPVIETPAYEEVPDDDTYDPPPREPVKPRVTRRTTAARRVAEEEYEEEEKREEEISPSSSQTSQQDEGRSGIPLWIKLLIVLCLIFFIYLVVVNMDPSTESKVPKSITDDSDSPV